jgi:uncharacterized protein (TIGR01732 family)
MELPGLGGMMTSVAVILVLFILLVIVNRALDTAGIAINQRGAGFYSFPNSLKPKVGSLLSLFEGFL